MRRQIMWTARQWPGSEHLDLQVGHDGVVADGLIIVAPTGEPIRLAYRIECDRAWHTRKVTLERHGHERTTLDHNEHDHWIVNGRERSDLTGCTDVDIALTPFTNTLPIRRLGLNLGDAADLRVVYIRPEADLTIEPAEQRYTRLDAGYRYESGSFRADLAVDRDGLVTDYPGLWSMEQPSA
ncbi:putative glycolipid-binding domain-containing protein [Glycomyces sp. TRM65418]|uniref:putative glycolipid-binding domain-containing protein n=1 Tax=Glycomyces sp. TRM65418 TaxID=2867006 RepID=UPI001CE5394F|nr:putative glycolipid-binding domain-containing protein [Glycomyces sp. TRM65418]MCC3763866.1 putative glycolipid-binding domain-containing protein [Glycomyces sp. TRM65418]QZD53569.1 putative glycolipid-binding domain-containing protein [Glycomyces sp. TRM65418]